MYSLLLGIKAQILFGYIGKIIVSHGDSVIF